MKRTGLLTTGLILALGVTGWSQATGPTSRPAEGADRAAREMDRLLKPSTPGGQPLRPAPDAQQDRTSGVNAVAPGAPTLNVLREGTLIVDRTGRIARSADGQHLEFIFDSDGGAMADPPIVLLPNLKLMAVENELSRSDRQLKFRITGSVTEYRGRNYILLDKVVVVPDVNQQF